MHIPSSFRGTDQALMLDLIQQQPLGTLVAHSSEGLSAHHLPFIVRHSGEALQLQGHINRGNALWQQCPAGSEVLVIFTGPDCYISPNYYPSKQRSGKAVPTWNYSAVHVRGRIAYTHDGEETTAFLADLSQHFESQGQEKPWQLSDAPADYIEKLFRAVVGICIDVEQIEGQFKYSQNKSAEDFAALLEGLQQEGQRQQEVVEYMKKLAAMGPKLTPKV